MESQLAWRSSCCIDVVLIVNVLVCCRSFFFFFNDTATTEIYTLSLHDALPIYDVRVLDELFHDCLEALFELAAILRDRKSTRLNSSHVRISYAVFCLKKKKIEIDIQTRPAGTLLAVLETFFGEGSTLQ